MFDGGGMPTRNQIIEELVGLGQIPDAVDIIRRKYLNQLHQYTGKDTIIFSSAFTTHRGEIYPPSTLMITDMNIDGFMSALQGFHGEDLDLIVHSPGGIIEATIQIINYLRMKFKFIRVIIPQSAFSAATILACACDEIVMAKHSSLGPTDPQISFPSQGSVQSTSAHSIFDEFDRATKEVTNNISTAPLWAGRLDKYPPGILSICQNSLDLSKETVQNNLKKYMFKDLDNPEGMAKKVAEWLISKDHKSHGNPISVMEAQEHGLIVHLLEDDQKLQEFVLSVFHSTQITFENTFCANIIENHNGIGKYIVLNPPPVS
jgi:ATP-dependent protease ClpP protease subunit